MSAIYLDHAATSFPKPPVVLRAMQRWFEELGVSAARGDSDACDEVAEEVWRVRRKLATECHMKPERVAFCSGATEAINLFLLGFLRDGDHVITTQIEHSSVVRPLVALRERGSITLTCIPCDASGSIDPTHAAELVRERHPRLLVFSHASNVTGAILPAAELVRIAHAHDCTVLCDASQSAGVLPLDFEADAIVASAHKSLLGPPGLGFLALRPGLELRSIKLGGTGSSQALETQPEEWPQALEAGTPNTPAIFGLGASLDWIASRSRTEMLNHGLGLCDQFVRGLTEPHGEHVEFHRPHDGTPRLPIVSFTLAGFDVSELGILLSSAGIHVRTGFHCAPWIHARLGTETAGTVRVSPGPFTTEDGIQQALDVLRS